MKACARFYGILIAEYYLNGLSVLDVKFANLAPLCLKFVKVAIFPNTGRKGILCLLFVFF